MMMSMMSTAIMTMIVEVCGGGVVGCGGGCSGVWTSVEAGPGCQCAHGMRAFNLC